MLGDGMLLDDEERFETLMERCADIQERANRSTNPNGERKRAERK